MKILLGIVGLLLTACAQTRPPTVAIRDVTVVDVIDGLLRADHTVLLAGNRIVAVGPAKEVRIPDDADVIDGAAGYLIPGLWDMHVHSVAKIAWDMRVRSVANVDWHFPLFLAHGVTGVRNMNDGTADVTLELTTSVKRRLAEGDLSGPRLLVNGPTINGDPPVLATNPVVVRTAAEARAVVDKLADGGADFIKVYETLSRDAYFAIMDQAQRRGIPVDGHVPFRVRPEEAADAGQRTVEHVLAMALGCSSDAEAEREEFERVLSGFSRLSVNEQFLTLFRHERGLYDRRDPAACAATIEAYRRNGMAEAPCLVGYHHIVNAAEILSDTTSMRLVPGAIRQNWQVMLESELGRTLRSVLRPLVPLQSDNVRLLNEAGVLLLAATDVGIPMLVPGISLHEELVLLVEAGLTPLEALRAATLNPARVLGLADSLGTIEASKLADLVLLDANPLVDIGNTQRIRAVVADGRPYRQADLDRLLAEVEALNQQVEKQE